MRLRHAVGALACMYTCRFGGHFTEHSIIQTSIDTSTVVSQDIFHPEPSCSCTSNLVPRVQFVFMLILQQRGRAPEDQLDPPYIDTSLESHHAAPINGAET